MPPFDIGELSRLLEALRGYVSFAEVGTGPVKRIAKPHQFFAVEQAVGKTVEATRRAYFDTNRRQQRTHRSGQPAHRQDPPRSATATAASTTTDYEYCCTAEPNGLPTTPRIRRCRPRFRGVEPDTSSENSRTVSRDESVRPST
jgi:hypothetical protein